jgi:hypothetical protein
VEWVRVAFPLLLVVGLELVRVEVEVGVVVVSVGGLVWE